MLFINRNVDANRRDDPEQHQADADGGDIVEAAGAPHGKQGGGRAHRATPPREAQTPTRQMTTDAAIESRR